ncbi:MAG: hypothetical protein PHY54_12190 [Methylococcales bacterium]|nr:hypothetical protein [Methylococcales bacterium]
MSDISGYLGLNNGSTGIAMVTGANSIWANSGDLSVGISGNGTLNIQNGGTVSVGNLLNIGDNGILNLTNGTLNAGTASLSTGGQFNWTAGTLTLGSVAIGTTGSLIGDTLFLDASHILNVTGDATMAFNALVTLTGSDFNAGGNLSNDGIMIIGSGRMAKAYATLTNTGSIIDRGTLQGETVNNGGLIQLAGNGKIIATTLNLNDGNISGKFLDMNNIGTLTGNGIVASAITGGTSANTIKSTGGTLTLGDANSATGFVYGGNLATGSNRVILLDQGIAQLGVATTLGDGGQLEAGKGINLSAGETLSYTGNASILGNFTNNGAVSGSSGALTFMNDVNGAGSFSGNIVFHAGYSTGNAPAAIDFNGGNVSYDATSVLTLDIFGNTPGTQFDQLLNINNLDFNGRLALVFGKGFTPLAGSSIDLFQFASFIGSFDPNRISVSGLDRSLLDFSNLAINGTLQVASVPLPAGVWLFVSGLTALCFGSRRRM